MKNTLYIISMIIMTFGIIWSVINQYHAGYFDWYKSFSTYERMCVVGPAYIPIFTGLIIYCFATFKK